MFRIEIEALVLLVVLAVAFLLYRFLIRSKWFSHLVRSTKPLPESSDDIISRLDDAECAAVECAKQAVDKAHKNCATARTIQRRISRKP
jgi:hypothetical protein